MYILLVVFSIIFFYAAFKQATASELKFDSQNVREIWQACSMQFKMISPYMPQETRMYLCDCYTDQMRIKFTPEQVKGLTSEKAKILGEEMKTLCPILSPQPTIDT